MALHSHLHRFQTTHPAGEHAGELETQCWHCFSPAAPLSGRIINDVRQAPSPPLLHQPLCSLLLCQPLPQQLAQPRHGGLSCVGLARAALPVVPQLACSLAVAHGGGGTAQARQRRILLGVQEAHQDVPAAQHMLPASASSRTVAEQSSGSPASHAASCFCSILLPPPAALQHPTAAQGCPLSECKSWLACRLLS